MTKTTWGSSWLIDCFGHVRHVFISGGTEKPMSGAEKDNQILSD